VSTLPTCCTSTRSKSHSFGESFDISLPDSDDTPDEVHREIAYTKNRPLALDLQLVAKSDSHSADAATLPLLSMELLRFWTRILLVF
jgi:hypothetical protein